jgi:hypothetical protein
MLRSARVGAYLCWFLVAGGAAAFGCGGSEKQSGEPSELIASDSWTKRVEFSSTDG